MNKKIFYFDPFYFRLFSGKKRRAAYASTGSLTK